VTNGWVASAVDAVARSPETDNREGWREADTTWSLDARSARSKV
jgi:hypothetical protein